jgi:hypothetical protein
VEIVAIGMIVNRRTDQNPVVTKYNEPSMQSTCGKKTYSTLEIRLQEATAMDNHSHQQFIALAKCHRSSKKRASESRSLSCVTKVTHWTDLIDFEDQAFRLVEYVDAELSNGRAISWQLEVTVMLDKFVVEADVSMIHEKGQDRIENVADYQCPTTPDGISSILETTERLCGINPISDVMNED